MVLKLPQEAGLHEKGEKVVIESFKHAENERWKIKIDRYD
jgi:hypothetical protein